MPKHFTSLGFQLIAKVGQQEWNAGMVQTVKGEWNHFHRTGGAVPREPYGCRIEIADLRVASPVLEAVIRPGVGDIQKLAVERMLRALFEILRATHRMAARGVSPGNVKGSKYSP